MRNALRQKGPCTWELPASAYPGMRVAARLYASHALLESLDDGVLEQLAQVAGLPGVLEPVVCMPDGHWGYGFPIGGVAAMDPAAGGVISPGGIGFDINCGMRLVRTNLTRQEVTPHLQRLVDGLFAQIPAGVGAGGGLRLSDGEYRQVLQQGVAWCVARGYGWPRDLDFVEGSGSVSGADVGAVSARALERGRAQLGTLGSGNHYLEIQTVAAADLADPETAQAMGLFADQVVVMLHTGSRGLGHQVATDYMKTFVPLMDKQFGIRVPVRELACAPFQSSPGQAYFAAQQCAVNMAFANRQCITDGVRRVFAGVFGRSAADLGMDLVFDVAHNIARLESHPVDGRPRRLLVHRKGATRALPPGAAELPAAYRALGQPIIIGGSMETGSYLLRSGPPAAASWNSSAHGSGRRMSRREATRRFGGRQLQEALARRGIYVRAASPKGLAEEAGDAYKDIDAVVAAAHEAGLSRPVARFRPLGNVKG